MIPPMPALALLLPILSLFVILMVSFVIIRISSIALMRTGLARDASEFQALSAFFSVGFTTGEAEMVVNHPLRRKIIVDTIIAGNVVMTGVIGSIVITFVQSLKAQDLTHTWTALGLIAASGITVLVLMRIGLFRRAIDAMIKIAMERSGAVRALDYELLFRFQDGFCVSEVEIDTGHGLIGQTIKGALLADHGVVVLSITRADKSFVAAPSGEVELAEGDTLLVYGRESVVQALADPRVWL